jgi:hypothetical protein
VRPLVVIVKKWAKNAGINDAKFSTLSSYFISLMVVHYLQAGTTPPVLPSLQEDKPHLFKGDSNIFSLPFLANVPVYSSPNSNSLGKLLLLLYVPLHSVFFGPFLSSSFFPLNDRAQNHSQEKTLLVLFLMTQKCLWTLKLDANHTFLNRWMIWGQT